MDDTNQIIILEPEEFFSRKELAPIEIFNVIKSIIESECFDEQKALARYNTFFKQHNQSQFKPYHLGTKQRTYSSGDKIKRELVACINIINNSNKTKILGKLSRLLQRSENKIDCLLFIINNACNNDLYMKPLLEVLYTCSEDERNLAKNIFYEKFMTNFFKVLDDIQLIDYECNEGFCAFMKMKTRLLNEHKCIMSLDYEESYIVSYFERLLDSFKYDKRHMIDMIVNMIISLVEKNNWYAKLFIAKCNDIDLYNICNQKTKFTLESFMSKAALLVV